MLAKLAINALGVVLASVMGHWCGLLFGVVFNMVIVALRMRSRINEARRFERAVLYHKRKLLHAVMLGFRENSYNAWRVRQRFYGLHTRLD